MKSYYPENASTPLTDQELSDIEEAMGQAIMMWRKRKQHARGQINLNIDANNSTYKFTVAECNEEIERLEALKMRLYWLVAYYEDTEVCVSDVELEPEGEPSY